MPFNKSNLETIFANLERVIGKSYPDHYAVLNEQGSTIAQIVFTGSGEMNIEVDNFPAGKQYFSSSIPCLCQADFVGDMKRLGINLVTAHDSE